MKKTNLRRPTVIAVDGPAASGKGTLSSKLASHLDFSRLDTGLIYRALGLKVLVDGTDPNDNEVNDEYITGVQYDSNDPDDEEPDFSPKYGYWGPKIY